jgi:DNA helicase HerA-like ATPase
VPRYIEIAVWSTAVGHLQGTARVRNPVAISVSPDLDTGSSRASSRGSSAIGFVESVAPSEIGVSVLSDAPHGTSFAEATIQGFPRINGYVVLPSERGSILAVVVWVGIDVDPFSGRDGSDRIGIASPRRRLKALPLGVLRRRGSVLESSVVTYELDRGVMLFPTVGDPVRLPTKAEAAAAAPSGSTGAGGLDVGSAPLAGAAHVILDPDRLFGRHLAVLGNTGSGKSCTLTHLIRQSARLAGENLSGFRAIVLDLNGEYKQAFADLPASVTVKRFVVEPRDDRELQLRVPFWLWNYREWVAFADASGKSQAPILRQALHILRTSKVQALPKGLVAMIAGRRIVRQFQGQRIEPKALNGALSALDSTVQSCSFLAEQPTVGAVTELAALKATLTSVLSSRRGSGDFAWKSGTKPLDLRECSRLLEGFNAVLSALGLPEFSDDTASVDSPVVFDALDLVELIELLAAESGADATNWVAPMADRLRIALKDERLVCVSGWEEHEDIASWLGDYLGEGNRGQIAVIDLSLVPVRALHLVTAVFVRTLLEALERHRRLGAGRVVPVLLAVEEAHALVRRRSQGDPDDSSSVIADLCREAFERIAREGRKFGLSLLVSSQRPSELSETVLSQCNTFLVHRIVNARDQDMIRRLIPDGLGAMMEEIQSLPSQMALLLGAATEVPLLLRVSDLEERYRPFAPNPDFMVAWREGREMDLASVASGWTSATTADAASDGPGDEDACVEFDEPPF